MSIFTPMKSGFQSRSMLVFKYLENYKREIIGLSFAALLSAFFSALVPLAAGNIIDSLITKESQIFGFQIPIEPAFFFLILWFIAQACANAIDWYIDLKNRYLDHRIYAEYIVRGTSHLLELPMAFHKSKKIGDIQNRLQAAADSISSTITDIIISALPQFLSIGIAFVITFAVNPILASLLALSVALYVGILLRVGPTYTKNLRKMRRAYNRSFGEVYDAVANAQAVKQANAEHYEKKRLYKNFMLGVLKYVRQMNHAWQIMNSSQRVIVTITQSCIYALSILMIAEGRMTIGELVMFNGYLGLFLGPFARLVNNWQALQNGLVALERSEKILVQKPEPYEDENAIILPDLNGSVEFRSVSFAYGKAQKTVLDDISFSVKPGSIVALVGESGVGKSTLVDLLSRYFEPSKGKILIDGHDIRKLNLQFLRSKIAVVPQEIMLFNDTIKNNLKYGSFGASDNAIREAVQAAHAEQFIEAFPKTYKQIVGERGVKLSVGQKQRLAIARAILRKPKILILDEPTSALDAKSEKLVEEALEKLMKGRTTFIIAHRLSTVRHADMILVLEKGRIVESGTHTELVAKEDGTYRKLYELQVGFHS